MRRLALIVVLAAAAAGALALPEPAAPAAPVAPPAPETATPVAGVWYCPWLESSFEREGAMALATALNASAVATFPNPEPGGQPDTLAIDLTGPGAALVDVTDVALRGDVPGFVEFSEIDSAAGVVVSGPSTLVADACVASVPKVWYLLGGSTRQGEALTLRLFNPFPETAIVSVMAASEFGPEPLTALEGVTVSPRTWTDVDLAVTLRLRDVLAVTVAGQEGIVLPALVAGNADDEAMWVGSGLGTAWEFPVVGAGSLAGSLAVYNPSPEPATVSIDLMTADGLVSGAEVLQLSPGEPLTVDLSPAVGATFGARVSSDRAIAAAVVSSGGGGLAAMVGAANPATRWILPTAGVAGDGVRSLWLSNSGDAPVTVTVRALGADGAGAVEKVVIPAGSLRQFITEPTTAYLAESLSPFVAASGFQGTEAAAFAAGVPIGG